MTTAAPSDPFKAWFPAYKPSARPARLRILCFPNAGSAENVFTGGYMKDKKRVSNHLMNWVQDADAEVLAVQLPGREQRRNEPFCCSCKEAASQLLPVVEPKLTDGVPYVIIAHSCGNWVAYELLKLLRERSLPLPQMFFVSCMAAPNIADSAKPWRCNGGLGEEEMKEECAMWDVNQVVFKPDVWPMFQPLLRADFTLFDTYTHEEAPEPFDFPIHGFFANADRRISREMVDAWRDFTTGEFTLELVRGHHLFVYDNATRDEWFETITDVLTGEGF